MSNFDTMIEMSRNESTETLEVTVSMLNIMMAFADSQTAVVLAESMSVVLIALSERSEGLGEYLDSWSEDFTDERLATQVLEDFKAL